MRRTIRNAAQIGMPIVGTAIVFGAILLMIDPMKQIAVAAVGVLLIQAGIWKLAHPILPSERKFQALRREVDHFIRLVRRLNAAALGVKEVDTDATRAAFEAEQRRMHESFERMAVLAGKTDEEVAALNLANAEVAAGAGQNV
jgi:uncharacterized membrane protein YccC